MQGLHCTHFLKHQYPSTPDPLFPTYPRAIRGLRASAVLLFYTDQMNRVHSYEEAPRSFTMAPCVVVEGLEAKQRCSRAAVSEHAGIQAREWSRWLFAKKREVNEKTTKPCNSPHTITTARRPDNIPLICTSAGPIHPVHSQPMSLATEAMPETRLHFCHFPAVSTWHGTCDMIYLCVSFSALPVQVLYEPNSSADRAVSFLPAQFLSPLTGLSVPYSPNSCQCQLGHPTCQLSTHYLCIPSRGCGKYSVGALARDGAFLNWS